MPFEVDNSDIFDAIEEVMKERLTDENASEYPFEIPVSFDKCGANLAAIYCASEENKNWLREHNIPHKTKLLQVSWPAIKKIYYFKNEQDALLFVIGQAGKYGSCGS